MSTHPLVVAFAGVAILSLATGCGAAKPPPVSPAAETVQGPLRVTLLLFSGLPNPVFGIQSPAVTEQLRNALTIAKPLIATESLSSAVPGLGYGGIRVENIKRVQGVPGSFFVYRQKVEIDGGASRKLLADDGQTLETTLLNEAVVQHAITQQVADAILAKK